MVTDTSKQTNRALNDGALSNSSGQLSGQAVLSIFKSSKTVHLDINLKLRRF